MPGVGPDVLKSEYARLAAGQGWQGQIAVTIAKSLNVQNVCLLIDVHLADIEGTKVVYVIKPKIARYAANVEFEPGWPGKNYRVGGSKGLAST
jgi:hypothetical protein